jgi:hypothetical protein
MRRNANPDQTSSAVPLNSDIARCGKHLACVPTRSPHLVRSSNAGRALYNCLDSSRESKQVLFDQNCNFIRNQERIKRIVTAVTQHELECVFTGWKFDTRFRLPRSKMKM